MAMKYQKKSVVRGHHIYKFIWTPTIGEEFLLEVEDGNEHKHAVASERSRTCATSRHLFETQRLFTLWYVQDI